MTRRVVVGDILGHVVVVVGVMGWINGNRCLHAIVAELIKVIIFNSATLCEPNPFLSYISPFWTICCQTCDRCICYNWSTEKTLYFSI